MDTRKIVHLTSVHPRHDTRIFIKQCRSLAMDGYDVSLVVADGKGDEYKDGVAIFDVGPPRSRIHRMLSTTRRVFDKAVALNADAYHMHDPELLPAGVRLKRLGKRVVFDSHEDVPKQLLAKPYLNPAALRLLSRMVARYERHACGRFDGIVAATPHIRDKFLDINRHTIDINNFPVPQELDVQTTWEEKRMEVCYVGDISGIRGVREMVRACEFLESEASLNLGGSFSEPATEAEVKSYPGWKRVKELGYLDRKAVREVLKRSVAGLVTLHPRVNYLDALPVKMFEYMAAGVPVIASDFPLWREIVEQSHCGICVDPLDPKAIARAIDHLVLNPEIARHMSENGRRAVRERFNWMTEKEKLLGFYARLF